MFGIFGWQESEGNGNVIVDPQPRLDWTIRKSYPQVRGLECLAELVCCTSLKLELELDSIANQVKVSLKLLASISVRLQPYQLN